MKRAILLMSLLLLAVTACQPANNTTSGQSGPDTAAPTAAATADTPAGATTVPTMVATPVATAVPVPAAIPTPTLFGTDWNDREPYRAGLTPEAQAVLDALTGAPVYHIDVQIGEDPSLIVGQQQVRYTNQETIPLDSLYFHQFPNLLGGSMEISNVLVNGTAVTPNDRTTVLEIPLAAPLQPGEQIVVQMDFVTRVPLETGRNYGILAFVDDVLALPHFYPMVAVYDAAGWDTEPAPPDGDVTYADTSFFQVRLTAPVEQTIATAGIVTDRRVDNGAQTLTIAAGPVRDFYIAMSERYEVTSTTVDGIRINSYAPAELRAGSEAALDTAASALAILGERYGAYPYTEFDLVGTPTLALGIEYPGIIANTLNIYDTQDESRAIYLESTVAHEVGHQWFYSLIGNDQIRYPWLDESVTQFATWQYFADRYGAEAANVFFNSFNSRWARLDYEEVPVGMPVAAYEGEAYSAIVYGRGPIFVHELRNAMGEDTFDTFMRTYSDTFRWGIATPDDFKALAEATCDCDLTELFEAWVFAE